MVWHCVGTMIRSQLKAVAAPSETNGTCIYLHTGTSSGLRSVREGVRQDNVGVGICCILPLLLFTPLLLHWLVITVICPPTEYPAGAHLFLCHLHINFQTRMYIWHVAVYIITTLRSEIPLGAKDASFYLRWHLAKDCRMQRYQR